MSADILRDGHRQLAARVRWCPAPDAGEKLREVGMGELGNDRWEAVIQPTTLGMHTFVVEAWTDGSDLTTSRPFKLWVDRERALVGAWYELFPRSEGGLAATAEARLPAVAAMGFDVVYLPPVHPIGRSHRKGRNNTLTAGADDPGSPRAIGSPAGGHCGRPRPTCRQGPHPSRPSRPGRRPGGHAQHTHGGTLPLVV